MMGTIVIEYAGGKFKDNNKDKIRKKKTGRIVTITLNLSVLFFFKYFNMVVIIIENVLSQSAKGFVNAIEDYESKSSKAGYSMADSARRGLSNAISKVSDLVENGIDSQPTIRPVLDLSDIKSRAGSISSILGAGSSIGLMSNVKSIGSAMNGRSQNGANSDVISAIENLGKQIGRTSGDTYQINGVTYDDGSNITDAVRTIIRAARVERRR